VLLTKLLLRNCSSLVTLFLNDSTSEDKLKFRVLSFFNLLWRLLIIQLNVLIDFSINDSFMLIPFKPDSWDVIKFQMSSIHIYI